jgi:hypothetical protein
VRTLSRKDAQVQVEPAAATIVYVNTADGNELTLDPGRQVVARVVAVGDDGSAKISLAGQHIDVQSSARLRVGDQVQLAVTRADAAGVRMTLVPPELAPATGGAGSGAGAAPSLIGELARAGVPVTPQLAQAVQSIVDQIGGGSTAARAVANLVSRDIALSPAAAARVAAALDTAGSLGPALAALATQSSTIADALPLGTPNAAALRSLLAPGLSSSELAVARIVHASQAASAGTTGAQPATVPLPTGSSTAVIQNYVASQVAGAARLDDMAALNSLQGALSGAKAATPPPALAGGLAPAAQQAALTGQGDARGGAASSPPAPLPATATAVAALPVATTTRSAATAAAATGAATAAATPTNARVAQAVADLAAIATRFTAAAGPAAGAAGAAAQGMGGSMNATTVAQQAGRDGSAGAAAASVAGAGASGDPMPLVSAMRAFLGSAGAEGDAQQLLRTLQGAAPATMQAAVRMLPESQTLQLAGQLLDLLPDGSQLRGPALTDLRSGVHAALDQLGRGLTPPGGNDASQLRAALEQVAANDPRPAIAQDAGRLLAALDGQQLLSRSATGADPGYVYFQVPMPDGRGAEVMVRREPGRREVSFDEFNIAFLLDTERLGTLMIQLDAHPASIRADVKTDIPELEPFLRGQAEALVEPLTRESRRQVVVTTGVFEDRVPTSLLEPQLGLIPGASEFYA